MNENQSISIQNLCKVTLLHEMWLPFIVFMVDNRHQNSIWHNYIDYFCDHQSGSMAITEILIKS